MADQEVLASPIPAEDRVYLALAQAIAMDLHELDAILKHHDVTPLEWQAIQNQPRFRKLLAQAVEDWNKPMNTKERVRIKAQAMVELGLETMWAQLHNEKEPLSARVELFKTVAKFGEIGLEKQVGGEAQAEKFSVTINLGQDAQLKIEKRLPPIINLDAHAANEELIAGIVDAESEVARVTEVKPPLHEVQFNLDKAKDVEDH